jgi:hypothetical protein
LNTQTVGHTDGVTGTQLDIQIEGQTDVKTGRLKFTETNASVYTITDRKM